MLPELKDKFEEIGKTVKALRDEHAEAIKKFESDIEAKFDASTKEKFEKLNNHIDKLEKQADKLETAMKRTPMSEGEKSEVLVAESKAYWNALANFAMTKDSSAVRKFLAEKKELVVDTDSQGGFLVEADRSGRVVQQIFETSPLRQVCEVVTLTKGDAMEGSYDDDEAAGAWAGERTARAETDTADLGMYRNVAHELYAMPKLSQKIIEDSGIDIGAWHEKKVADIFRRKENLAFVSGTGVNQPRGFLTYEASSDADVYTRGKIGQVETGTASVIGFDDLIKLQTSLKDGYNGSFAMDRTTVRAIRLLKDTTNQYLWQPSLQAGQPATLLGDPLLQFNDMPAIADGALPVAYADWKMAYQIVDRLGISVLQDPFTTRPFVMFYTRKRVGGQVVGFDAIKLLKIKAA